MRSTIIMFLNQHQNNPPVTAQAVRHSNPYIILYVLRWVMKRK